MGNLRNKYTDAEWEELEKKAELRNKLTPIKNLAAMIADYDKHKDNPDYIRLLKSETLKVDGIINYLID